MDTMAPVFDPDIPAGRARLPAGENKALIAFGAGRADLDKARHRQRGAAIVRYVLSVVVIVAILDPAGMLASRAYPGTSGVIWFICALIFGVGFVSFVARFARSWAATTVAVRFHRRYVLPASDFDPEASRAWDRAVRASSIIEEARPVRERRLDTARLRAALPRWKWEIAEGLARLSAARAAQRTVPGGAGEAHEVGALARPPQADAPAAAGIERRLRELEDIARQVAEDGTAP